MRKESRDGSNPKDLLTAQQNVQALYNQTPVIDGMLKKRGARMHRWSTRYVMLTGPKLSYKLKRDSPALRGSFDLVSGCILTEIQEESQMKGKKLYSFWLVWPQDKGVEEEKAAGVEVVRQEDSDDEFDIREEPQVGAVQATAAKVVDPNKPKDLKSIVQTEAMSAELQRRKAEDQLQRHQSDDANLNLGMRVAAVTVGGVVVGALTAGIGLVPYLAVVGIVAAASGGAVVLQYRRPSDSRLILASEDLSYISQWRAALEEEITKIEMNGKPHLPAGADVNIISHILGMSGAGGLGGWKRVGVIEGMRIMEQKEVVDGYNCRKAQLVVRCSPTNAFIVIMDISSLQWPKNGYIKVANHVDDHVDILEVDYIQRRSRKDPLYKSKNCGFSSFMTFSNRNSELVDHVGMGEAECRSQTTLALGEGDGVRVSGNLSRFWRLDDDGSYIIILTTDDAKSEVASDKNTVPLPQLTAVCTVSPRRDYDQFDEDIPFALISCTIQVQDVSGMWLDKQFLDDFLTDYLTGLLEVRQAINAAKYDSVSSIKELISPDHSEHGLSYWLGPSPSSVSGALDDMPTGIFSDPDVAPRRKLVERGDSGRFDGVATVQPGLDEGAARGAVRSITRVLSASDGEGNQKQTPPVKKKKRSRKEKAEASNLRNLIATKEYELQRTEKLIQKKGSLGAAQKLASSSSPVSAGGPYSAAASAQEIMHVLNSLQCDLRDLKDSYHKLTGISFESSSKRRFLPRMRGKEKLSREDRQERFDAAFAAALATGDHPASPNVVRHSLDRLAKEKQIFEARNQLTVTCSENESGDEKPYPRMWKVSLSAEKANRTEIRTAFRRGIGGQNILVIALYIFAMAVSVLFEKNVIVMTAYIDFLLLSSGYSCSMICDKIDCAVNTAAIVIRNILKLLYSNLAGIFHRFWLASNAFMDQLLTPT